MAHIFKGYNQVQIVIAPGLIRQLSLLCVHTWGRVVHNPAILIPLVEKNGNPATFAVNAIFENNGKK